MKVTVTLLSSQRSELMAYVREASDTWNCLHNAVRAGSKYLPFEEIGYKIVCDGPGAEVLLFTAMRHCPEAVDSIKAAIIAAQAMLH